MVKVKLGALILAVAGAIILSGLIVKRLENQAELPAIVPFPQRLEMQHGTFTLRPAARIVTDSSSEATARLLAERLQRSTGYPLPVNQFTEGVQESGAITMTCIRTNSELGPEGYELTVQPTGIEIRAPDSAGLFYGSQSLLQLLPPQVFSKKSIPGIEWKLPCLRIEDKPRFPWRGMMLDVSRHFFSVREVEHFLDVMALHKLNTFHWHLTDDQGWRIEIKKYPRLTEVGAWRERIGFNLDPKSATAYNGAGQYGGFYSQADVREIVAYALARHITIVPEIEMPGHSSAALASYPQLSCSGGPYTTDMSKAVSVGVFCVGKEETFEFLKNVLTEVMDLFPGQFIHLGGDEVTRENWRNCARCQELMKCKGFKNEHEFQSFFVGQIEKFVNAHGRRLIGWSEIRNDHLGESTVVMDWIGGAVEAARTGHDVVRTPEEFCYFDFYQSKDRASEPTAAGAYLPLSKVYAFEPVPTGLGFQQQSHILGSQGNLWTEYIPSPAQLEYMALPRMSALAEMVWSPKNSRNWQDFLRRLGVQEQRFDQLGIQYRRDGKRSLRPAAAR